MLLAVRIALGLIRFMAGAAIFSFFDVIAWRLPRALPIARGRSVCPACGAVLGARDLVPVFSWLFLRGRCRRCGGRLCVGTRMTARDTLEDTLASIHLLAGQQWQGHTEKCPDGNKDFREVMIRLFHEDDRQAVQGWLSQQEGPTDDRQTGAPEQEVR